MSECGQSGSCPFSYEKMLCGLEHAVISNWSDPPGVVVMNLRVSTAGRFGVRGEQIVWATGSILPVFLYIYSYLWNPYVVKNVVMNCS